MTVAEVKGNVVLLFGALAAWCVYSDNCNMELNANLAPLPQQDAVILGSLWGGMLETSPHKAGRVW